MGLAILTDSELIFPQLDCSDRASLLRTMARRVVEKGYATDADELYDRLVEREELGSTGVGAGVAIPHCKLSGLDRVVLALASTREGIDFGAVDGAPVRLFFLVVSPASSPAAHLQCLAAISKWVKGRDHVTKLLTMTDPQKIYEQLQEGD